MRDTVNPRVEVVYPIPHFPVCWSDPNVIAAMSEWADRVRAAPGVEQFIATAPQDQVQKWFVSLLKGAESSIQLDLRISWAENCVSAAEANAERWTLVKNSVESQLKDLRRQRKRLLRTLN